MDIVDDQRFRSVAFPVIGGSAGGFGEGAALGVMQEEFETISNDARAVVIRYRH